MISDAEAQCPIQTKLVQKELLSPDQLKWLNDYHTEVLDKVIPVLERFQDSAAIAWLRKECQPISTSRAEGRAYSHAGR